MSPFIILTVILVYFAALFVISWRTGRQADHKTFFSANRNSPWPVVAFGMIGASLSGVTFISIPGAVGAGGVNQDFSYMQVVLGYLLGYVVIAHVLLPVYYRLRLTSIYTYLEQRFGFSSYKTGAAFFLLSRIIGASFRLYLVAIVLDAFVLGPLGLPFAATVAGTIALIWLYTFRGGIKTVVWTDTFQTAAMLIAVVLTFLALGREMGGGLVDMVRESEYSQLFFFENGWSDPNNFFKQFFSGMFITIVMTGLDQDMMQKNLTCRSLGDAQKNMYGFSLTLIVVNLLFLALGAALYLFAQQNGIAIPEKADQLYPTIALQHLSPAIGIIFVLGLVAAAYSSADSALTALTTSFCIDFLDFEKKPATESQRRLRLWVHLGFSVVLFLVILIFWQVNDDSVINSLFRVAGYTYGPLLGLYAFGLFTRWAVRDRYVPIVALISPALCYLLNLQSQEWLNGYKFGFELLILNGAITFLGLWILRKKEKGN
jgi:Na+/proline symporter